MEKQGSEMKKIIVLGGGLVGRHIAVDLSKDHQVTCIDLQNLESFFEGTNVCFKAYPIQEDNVETLTEQFDIVVSALPGKIGYNILRTLASCGRSVVDISFMEQDPTDLKQLAEQNNATIVTDMGVAPGLCGVWLAREVPQIKNITHVKIMVGGIPLEPEAPYYYKAPFEPAGVIAEYTRPVRMRENGIDIIKQPFTGLENIIAPQVKTDGKLLQAFNTDGCRTLLTSFPQIPNMVEKTIRWKGHIDFMLNLQAGGFFNDQNIENTSKVLLKAWKSSETDKELTLMEVEIIGDKSITYTLYDQFKDKVPSMARTTGYTCNAVVNLIANQKIGKGLHLPEDLGDNLEFITKYLKDRDIEIERTER